jgi:hypothetical protein
MAKDKQSESSKLDQKNAEMDKAQEEGYKRYQKKEADEAKENAAPRKAIGDAVDYVKNKASKFGSDFVEGAKQYGEAYKKGLGMKSGGKVSSASSRGDGIATKGKTRGKIV